MGGSSLRGSFAHVGSEAGRGSPQPPHRGSLEGGKGEGLHEGSVPRKAPQGGWIPLPLCLDCPSFSPHSAPQHRQGPERRPFHSPSEVLLSKETKRLDTSRAPGSTRQPKAGSRARPERGPLSFRPPPGISTGGLQVGASFLVHHLLFQDENARISRAPERGFKIIWEEEQEEKTLRDRNSDWFPILLCDLAHWLGQPISQHLGRTIIILQLFRGAKKRRAWEDRAPFQERRDCKMPKRPSAVPSGVQLS